MATYNNQDFKEILKNESPIGYSYTNFDRMIRLFDISRLPDYDNAAEPYIAYILMSRPNLYVADATWTGYDKNNKQAYDNFIRMQNLPMSATFANDQYGQEMLRYMSYISPNVWLPIITTKAMSYSVGNTELKTIDKGNTYYGHKIVYGKHSEDHKIGGTISIDFRNDRFHSVLKMMQLWMAYIYNVSKNDAIVPSVVSQKDGILDYAASIYYLVTRRDGRELVYWEKLTGVFPISLPYSIFSSDDNLWTADKVSIDFAYGIKSDPNDPEVLLDINFLAGDSYETMKKKSRLSQNAVYRYSSANAVTGIHDGVTWNNKEAHGLGNIQGSGSPSSVDKVDPKAVTKPNYREYAPYVTSNLYSTNPFIRFVKANNGSTTGTLKYYLLWESR